MTLFLGAILSFVFFSSSYSKITNIKNFQMEIASYGIHFIWIPIISWAILIFEIGLSVVFLSNDTMENWKQVLAIAFIILLSVFTIIKNGIKNNQCSCFGINHPLSRFPVQRNAVVLLLLIIDFFLPNETTPLHLSISSVLVVLCVTFILENIKLKNELFEEF
ncbi:MauE/DoxX family redox-associated membrane protein [Cohnella faecalis]|uniref:Methylamine utilisation protein MauE domain-containing protein n=1 Tax=Cohnella faecalis TaxID=2315694 RepID=A0A398CEM4_9BACL|nr:MauE/DoxX family redox-associated membrane protein [Cohnella faecalis]RIE00312.1 hypothetical protein D3H35_29280 [Cohnella faecalis]RIE02569.1 hypothetical protein D3H35_17950 [Cohnella faecalis]